MWIIAIDGGGTKCDAGLFSTEGKLISTARSGAANVFANFEGAIEAIELACDQLIESANKQLSTNIKIKKEHCFLSLGCAGGGVESAKLKFDGWQHQYAGAILNTDAHVSCLAANKGDPCALFIIGTGSCLAVFQNNEVKQYGGHGFLLGDYASGAWLGKQAVSWYLKSLEIPNPDSELKSVLEALLGCNISDIIQQYGQANAGKFGALAPNILAVDQSSITVKKWLLEGAQYVSDLLSEHTLPSLPVFLTGGLAPIYQPLLTTINDRSISIPNENAVYGAYLAAKNNVNRAD
jgi:glucosamine kinase